MNVLLLHTGVMTQPGWYPEPSGLPGQRYFDGSDWTGHYMPDRQVQPVSYGPAVVVHKPVNHAFHLLMTLFTCGLWGIVWIIVAVANSGRTVVR